MMQTVGRGMSSLVRGLAIPKVANTRRSRKRRGKSESTTKIVLPALNTASHPPHLSIFPTSSVSCSLTKLKFSDNEHSDEILFDAVQRGLRQSAWWLYGFAVEDAPH
jgi:hypothetical protein